MLSPAEAAKLTWAEQLIWWEGAALTPLELSLPAMETTDPALLASCKGLHAFMRALLEDMLHAPREYYLNPGEYEAFLNGRSEFEARRENKEKHNQAHSKAFWLTGFHQQFLLEISRRGQVRPEGLVVSRADFDVVVRSVGKSPYLKGVDARVRLAALGRVGFEIIQDGGTVFLTWRPAPDLFAAMARLSQGAEKDKTYGLLNFKSCNFVQIERPYRPEYAVVTHPLPAELAGRADRINRSAAANKMSPVCYTPWKMSYAYQGLAAMRFSAFLGTYELHVNYGLNPAELAHFERLFAAQPAALQEFCLEHLNVCRNCGFCQSKNGMVGNPWTIQGRQRRVCGLPALRVTDPAEAQMDWIERVIELRLETIRAARAGRS
jgi:hypothetical protein